MSDIVGGRIWHQGYTAGSNYLADAHSSTPIILHAVCSKQYCVYVTGEFRPYLNPGEKGYIVDWTPKTSDVPFAHCYMIWERAVCNPEYGNLPVMHMFTLPLDRVRSEQLFFSTSPAEIPDATSHLRAIVEAAARPDHFEYFQAIHKPNSLPAFLRPALRDEMRRHNWFHISKSEE